MPYIAVIIPTFNAEATLAVQLDALGRQAFDRPWELIIADNGSTDGTVALAREYASSLPLRIVDAHEIRGPGFARNVGVVASRAPRLAFVDADDEVGPDWLAAIARAIDEHGVVASRLDVERLNTPQVRASRSIAQEHGLSNHSYVSFLPHASASGLGVRRGIHTAIGGFDRHLRALEDTDYCWRVQLAGHRIHFEPDALVHYRLRATTAGSLVQSFAYGRFNGYLYVRYRRLGMAPVSLTSDVRRVALLTARLLFRDPRSRGRSIRSLVNRLGIMIGRIQGATLVALGLNAWLVDGGTAPPPPVTTSR